MNEQRKHSIVAGVDFSDLGNRALREALAQARGGNAEVHVVHAVTPAEIHDAPGTTRIEKRAAALGDTPKQLWGLAEEIGRTMETPPDPTDVFVHVRLGEPTEVIQQVAIDYEADFIVVGTHGRRGMQRMLLGSVASDLVARSRCPVLVCRPKDYTGLPKTERLEPPRTPGTVEPEPREPHLYVGAARMWVGQSARAPSQPPRIY